MGELSWKIAHIGENYYNVNEIGSELSKEGLRIESVIGPHELMSVLISIKVFKRQLEEMHYDKDLFFRLITGSKLNSEGHKRLTPIRRAVINILNSPFDVDKMDYIMRDSASAGIPTMKLDLDRIINSVTLEKHPSENELVIAFGKSGFSVVSAIINNRNYMYKWIYGHHKVQYMYHVVTNCLNNFCKLKNCKDIFSYDVITGTPVSIDGLQVSYTDDYDLWYMLKNMNLPDQFRVFRDQLIKMVHYKAFWKTKIEFDEQRKPFESKLKHIIAKLDNPDAFFDTYIRPKVSTLGREDILIFKHEPKIIFPTMESNMFFCLKDKKNRSQIKDYKALFGPDDIASQKDNRMFHVFIKEEKYSVKTYNKIIEILADL